MDIDIIRSQINAIQTHVEILEILSDPEDEMLILWLKNIANHLSEAIGE